MFQGHRTVPQIYLNGEIFVAGGWEGLSKMNANEIKDRLFPTNLGNL
jgi:glutaredoxin-related protein